MKRLLTFSTAVVLTLLPRVVAGQEPRPVDTIPPGEDKIVPIELGKPAPFEGQLFENNTALRWANWLRQYKYRLKVDVDEQRQICTIHVQAEHEKLLIETAARKDIMILYERKLAEAQAEKDNPPFYKTFWFGTVVGVVATSAVAGLTLWASHN